MLLSHDAEVEPTLFQATYSRQHRCLQGGCLSTSFREWCHAWSCHSDKCFVCMRICCGCWPEQCLLCAGVS